MKGLVATGTNSLKSDASSAAKGVKHAKCASKGPNVIEKISSGTSKCGDTLKGVAKSVGSSEKSFSKEIGTSLVFSSQSSNLVQEHQRASPGKMPSQDKEKGPMVKVDLEEVVEDKDEIGNEVKFSIGANTGVVEIAEIVCQCGMLKTVRTVKKESGNKGRKFFTCPKKLKPCIGSFQWCDQVAPTIQGSGSFGGTQALELNQDIRQEIKEIEIIDANGERIAPAKLNNNLQTMYQRLQAGKFQCNNCGKVLSGRQKIMVHLEAHLGLSLPCSVLENFPPNSLIIKIVHFLYILLVH